MSLIKYLDINGLSTFLKQLKSTFVKKTDTAGTDFGLVKSGGDVTISNGIINVNDNSHNHTVANVTGLQTALDGKAPSSHGTHVTYADVVPKANGTASTGTSAKVSREDHIHPLQTSVSGSAGSVPWSGVQNKPSTFTPTAHKHTKSEITDFPTSMPASDVPSWAKASTKPTYTKDEVGLNNVPNVTTNNQTPTFTKATSLTDLTSGETLTITFGKIAKAITDLIAHLADSVKHITASERTNWNAGYNHSKATHAPTNAEVNQNAFSNVKVGTTTIAADTKTDTLELVAGSNVTITPDATNDKVTISATDTKYTHPTETAYANGFYKITTNNLGHVTSTLPVTKADITTALGYTPPTTNTTYGVATSSTLGLVKSGTDITVDSSGNVSVNDDSHNHIISNVDGLQSALDGKAPKTHEHGSLQVKRYSTENTFGNISAFDRAQIDVGRSCKTAFMPASAITVEYSDDNGVTWKDYGASDTTKMGLFSMNRETLIRIGNPSATQVKVGMQTRVTIIPSDRYVSVDQFYSWLTVIHPTIVDIERSTIGAKTTFTKIRSDVTVSGWSGNNVINFSKGTFGGSSSQTSNSYAYRFTFKIVSLNSNTTYLTNFCTITDLRMYGDDCWSVANDMMLKDHLYGWDHAKNATFPANVKTNGVFVGNLDGNAKTATTATTANSAVKLDSSGGSATQPVYFSGGKPVACTYTLGKSVPSDAKFTDTTYSAASATNLGLVKTGSNITNTSGTISLTKANVTSALGYTPPTTDTKYTLPAATSSALGGIKTGYSISGKNYPVVLDANSNAYVNVPWTDNNTTYSNFVKSGSGAKSGLVPAPSTTAGTTKYLREDGTWAVPPDTNTTYTLSSFGVTASATELNYTDGVTSNIQTQLNGKSASNHNHDTKYQAKGDYAPSSHKHAPQVVYSKDVQPSNPFIDMVWVGGA